MLSRAAGTRIVSAIPQAKLVDVEGPNGARSLS